MKQFLLALTAAFALLSPAEAAAPKVYSVIFEIQTGPEHTITSMTVSKVIDPCSGRADAVNVPVPDVFVATAREQMAAQPDLPADGKFYTYLFYDPRFPDRTDMGPGRC